MKIWKKIPGSVRMVLITVPAPFLAWYALDGEVSRASAAWLTGIAGFLVGFSYGVYHAVERMYKVTQHEEADSHTTQEILDRIL